MQPRIYNGTNHTNIIYNPKDCFCDRQNKHFLQKIDAKPIFTIKRDKPLNAQVSLKPLNNANNNLPIYYADSMSYISLTPIDDNPANYDIIIVSNIYATLALQACYLNADFVDRLYIPIPLFDKLDPTRKIGCAGLKKVCRPLTPQEYLFQIRSGYIPSIASLQTCLDWFSNQPIDYATAETFSEIQQYISGLTSVTHFMI